MQLAIMLPCQTYCLSCPSIAGGSEMLMGLCITVTCIVELPIFAANNWILKKLGVNSVIHVTLAVCVIRMVNMCDIAIINCHYTPYVCRIHEDTHVCLCTCAVLHKSAAQTACSRLHFMTVGMSRSL